MRRLSAALLCSSLLAACAAPQRVPPSPAPPVGVPPAAPPQPPAPPPGPTPEELRAQADAAFTQGTQAAREGRPQEALAPLTRCTELAPARTDCLWALAQAHGQLSDWAAARTTYDALLELEPTHQDALDARAHARAQARLAELRAQAAAGPLAPAPADARLRLRAGGDTMLGTDFPSPELLPPGGGTEVLAGVKALLLDADLTFLNLEGPLCDGGETLKCRPGSNCYAFRTPTSYVQSLVDAGLDLASTANNHAFDFGELCRRQTEAVLDTAGIAWSGPPGTTASVEKNGLKVGLVAFHTSGTGNLLHDLPAARELVALLAATHHVVVVSFHGGREGKDALRVPHGPEKFYGEDRGNLRAFVRTVVDAGADLVLGHGPHVVRGVELVDGRLAAYSLGNFATYGPFNLRGPQGLGALLDVTVDAQGAFVEGRLIPTVQSARRGPTLDPEGRVLTQVRRLNRLDFPRTGLQVGPDGTLTPARGATPPARRAPASAP